MYYLVRGQLEIPEIGKVLGPGAVLGEIGIFAREQKRIVTVVCVSDCELYEMSGDKAKQLYFQDRSFGFALLQLIILRLMENVKLAQAVPPGGNASDKVVAPA